MSTALLLDAEPALELDDAAPAERQNRSSWPRTRLVSAACTVGLALALAAPLVFADVPRAVLPLTLVPLCLATMAVRWAFDSRTLRVRGRLSVAVVLATFPGAATGVGMMAVADAVLGIAVNPLPIALSLVLVVAVICAAAAARAIELRVRRASRLVYLLGSDEQRRDMQRQARRHGDMRVVGFARPSELTAAGPTAERLAEQIQRAGATSVVLSGEAMRNATICAAASLCNLRGHRVRALGNFYEEQFKRIPLSDLTPSWFLFDIAEIHRPRLYAASRRGFEMAFAAASLLLLAPLLAVIAAVIAASSRGPVLFRQVRVGRADEPFTVVKFRTMRPAEDAAPQAWATSEDARITTVGRWLRRFRLDELPQLWNVLRGQLSLIGPRPEQVQIARQLEAKIPFYAARHAVRPGLTGWAQVNCGYAGSLDGTLEKLQFDLYYVKHQSLRLDLLILASTLRAMLRDHDGVSHP
jgi:exopolysaccharide biosynthesis polyprenyl glycosylphosphotransferase